MKKLALSLSLALALSSVSTVFAAIPQKVRIGTDPTYAPFESKNAQGELVGFDIDLAKELCKRINTQCTFIENPLDALIPSLKAKKIDAIMSSLSITEKRQQEIAFTDKLYAADSRLVVSEGFLKQPIGKDYQFGGPSIKDEKLFGVGTGMGLRKEDNELREALNKAFAEMRQDGTYDKLAKKYFDFNVYGD